LFDFAWSELLVIGVVTLVVVGPKDLPRVLRAVGQMVGKARSLAREFQGHLDDMIRESELDELRQKAAAMTAIDEPPKPLAPPPPGTPFSAAAMDATPFPAPSVEEAAQFQVTADGIKPAFPHETAPLMADGLVPEPVVTPAPFGTVESTVLDLRQPAPPAAPPAPAPAPAAPEQRA